MALDVDAATAAYLAQLSPEGHLKAMHYTQGGHWLLLWGCLVSLVSAWIILRSGVLVRTERSLQRRKPRPWLSALVLGLIFMALDTLISLPWTIYSNWWREKSYGLTSQTLGGWFGEFLMGAIISVVLGGLFLSLVYWLIRRAPRTWPIWTGLAAAAAMVFMMLVAPLVIEPLFNTYKPAPPGTVRDTVVTMGKQVGVPTGKIFIYNGSKQSNRYTANVSGLFGSARVAMSDVMFSKGADLAEVKGVVGHEMGHYVHKHVLIAVPFVGVLVALFAWLAQLLFPRVQAWLRADDISGIADPAGLPILMAIVAVLTLLATPLLNTESRLQEADADNFSAQNFNEPDGLAKALVKTIEYRYDSPGKLEEFLFYDHPSVRWRVRNMMEWKAAHPKAAPVTGTTTTPAP